MNDSNPTNKTNPEESTSKNEPFNIVGFDSDRPSQTVFKIFGYELIAPSGMKNPAFIYSLFIIVNLIIVLFLRTKL